MTKPPISAAEAAARLAAALDSPDTLACEEAEARIPALLDAERAGEEVTGNPAFAALLQHMDQCAKCLDLYEQLAQDFEAVVGETEAAPSVMSTPPVFFAEPIRKGDYLLLQVMRGLVRRFAVSFDLPRLAPSLATLSGPQSLYSGTLSEIAGTPFLAMSVSRDADGVWLQIAVREPGQQTRWRLQLDAAGRVFTATTDSRGVARLLLPLDRPPGEVRLQCEELPVEPQNE